MSLLLLLVFMLALSPGFSVEMDVKCAVYKQGDDGFDNNVDVRIFVLGLKPNTTYTANVLPDHNPPSSITTTTDYEGILWAVSKIADGENSLLFKVDIYEGYGTKGPRVATGDDDAPCYSIRFNNS